MIGWRGQRVCADLFIFFLQDGEGGLEVVGGVSTAASFISGLCPMPAEVALLCIPTKGLTVSPKQLQPIVELVSNQWIKCNESAVAMATEFFQ